MTYKSSFVQSCDTFIGLCFLSKYEIRRTWHRKTIQAGYILWAHTEFDFSTVTLSILGGFRRQVAQSDIQRSLSTVKGGLCGDYVKRSSTGPVQQSQVESVNRHAEDDAKHFFLKLVKRSQVGLRKHHYEQSQWRGWNSS